MRTMTAAVLALGWALISQGPARADGKANAVLDKAIEAHGGEAELKKLDDAYSKIKGTVHVMGMDVAFSGEMYSAGKDKVRADLEVEVNGMKFKLVNIVNKDQGWTKFADQGTMDLDKDKIANEKENMYLGRLITLVPLKDKKYTVSLVGDDKVGDAEVTVIRISSKGHADASLFFDKKNHLLLKSDFRVKDDMSGQEVNEERLYSDYNDKGLRQPRKLTIKRDGKAYMEAEVSEMKIGEKFDDNIFAKP